MIDLKLFFGIDIDRQNVEPEKRLCAGRYGWVSHRFDIKGGKTGRETYYPEWKAMIAANVTRNNPLFKKLTKKAGGTGLDGNRSGSVAEEK